MKKGTVKFFNETKGFGRLAEGGRHTPFHNKYRPAYAIESRDILKAYFETGESPTQDRMGNHPDTVTLVGIAAKNVVRFKAGSELSGKVN